MANSEIELQGRFNSLRDIWRASTDLLSDVGKITSHPAYREIIRIGEPAIPLILEDLIKEGPNHWFQALKELPGDDFARGEQTVEGARAMWLKWGETQGYIHRIGRSEELAKPDEP